MKGSKKKGFTLIELIVVIAILGILAAIALPRLSGFQKTAKYRADVASARVIATAASTFYALDPNHNYVGGSVTISGTATTITSANLWTTITAFTDLLPSSFTNVTQFDSTSTFVVNIESDGDVIITADTSGGSTPTTLYPNPSTTAPTATTY